MDLSFPTFKRLLKRDVSFGPFWPLRVRSDQRKALLRLIATAAEQRLALTPLLIQWGLDERGFQRGRIRRLVWLLESNVALPDAIEQTPGVLDDEDVLSIRFGGQTGMLPQMIRHMLDDFDLLSHRARAEVRRSLVYLVFLLLVGLTIFTFLQIKIVPVLRQIIADFDSPPTRQLQRSLELGPYLANLGWMAAILFIAGAWFLFSTRAGRSVRRSLFDRYFGPLREWRAAEVVQRLAVVSASGRPLPAALSTLARYHFDQSVRHKLLFARNEIEQGADLWQSLATVELLSPREAQVMETATRVGNRPWVLKHLAKSKKLRVNRRLERLSELLIPLLVFVAGSLVLWQATAVFSTLIAVVEAVE